MECREERIRNEEAKVEYGLQSVILSQSSSDAQSCAEVNFSCAILGRREFLAIRGVSIGKAIGICRKRRKEKGNMKWAAAAAAATAITCSLMGGLDRR